MDDGCNNNLNSTVNSESQNSTGWSYSGNASLIEPEILEDMGVSMLEDGIVDCEKTSGDCIILSANLVDNKKPSINEVNGFEYQEKVYTTSSLENTERWEKKIYFKSYLFIYFLLRLLFRIQQESYDLDELAAFSNENESGYSSRMEADYFGDLKANFINEKMNASADKNEPTSLDNFCLFRRKRKLSVEGEDKFNKLSDEIILMILKWLPKKCLVRKFYILEYYRYMFNS